VYNKKL